MFFFNSFDSLATVESPRLSVINDERRIALGDAMNLNTKLNLLALYSRPGNVQKEKSKDSGRSAANVATCGECLKGILSATKSASAFEEPNPCTNGWHTKHCSPLNCHKQTRGKTPSILGPEFTGAKASLSPVVNTFFTNL